MSASGASGNSELRLSMTTSSSAHSAAQDSPQPAMNVMGDGTCFDPSAVGLNSDPGTGTGYSTPARTALAELPFTSQTGPSAVSTSSSNWIVPTT